MVSTEWAAPGQGQRTVNLGGTAGHVNVSRPNVDGSFLFSYGVRSRETSEVPTSGDVDSNFVFGGTNAG